MGLFHDDGIYAVTSTAIAEGEEYRIISVPTEPPETKCPILYPLILAGVWRLFPDFPQNVSALKTVNIVTLIWFLSASAVLFKRLSGWRSMPILAAFTLAIGLNPLVMASTDTVLSDNLFAPLFVSALLLHMRVDRKPDIVACAMLTRLALITRQVGIALAVSGLIWAALRRTRARFAAYACVLAAFTAGSYAASSRRSESDVALMSYYTGYETASLQRLLSSPATFGTVILDNLGYARDGLDASVLPTTFAGTGWLFAGLALIGLPTTLKRARLFVAMTTAAYLLIVFMYPFDPTRYFLPLVPLLFIALFEGTRVLGRIVGGARVGARLALARGAAAAPIALIVLSTLAWANWNASDGVSTKVLFWIGRTIYSWTGFTETFGWIRSNTNPTPTSILGVTPNRMSETFVVFAHHSTRCMCSI